MIGDTYVRRTWPYMEVDTDGNSQGRIPKKRSVLSPQRKIDYNV